MFGNNEWHMDTPISVAVISAAAAIVVPAVSFYWSRRKDRDAEWHKYKFDQYQAFVKSMSGIVGTDVTPDGQREFTRCANSLLLLASADVLSALQEFQREISVSNRNRSTERHDQLLSRLVWEIRRDMRIPRTPPLDEFRVWLSCSGTSSDQKSVESACGTP